jgi:hypothetical protein
MKLNVRVQRCYYNEKFKECVLTREQCFKLGAVCEYCEVAKDRLKDLFHIPYFGLYFFLLSESQVP